MIKILAQDGPDTWIDYGVAFHGIPSGYELTSLIEALKLVSSGDSKLSETTREALAKIEDEVDIQVYVTPTCLIARGPSSWLTRWRSRTRVCGRQWWRRWNFPMLPNNGVSPAFPTL